MRWRVLVALAGLACALASLSAQTARPVTFVWDVDPGDSGVTAEVERNGSAIPCPAFTAPSPTERRCTATVPTGAGSFRLRMGNIESAWGPWSPVLTATIPPGVGPGAFTLRFHRFSQAPAVMPNFVDTFNRSDSATLGSLSGGVGSWVESVGAGSGLGIVSNQAGFSSASGESEGIVAVNTQADSTDHYAEIVIANVTGGGGANAALRVRGTTTALATGYLAFVEAGAVRLWNSATEASLGSYSFTPSFPLTLRLEANGTTIRVLVDGVQRISVTNSAHTTGRYVGFGVYGPNASTVLVDSFNGGDPAGGAVASFPFRRSSPYAHLLIR